MGGQQEALQVVESFEFALLNFFEVVIINMAPEAFQEVFAAGGVEGRDRVADSECDTKHERGK